VNELKSAKTALREPKHAVSELNEKGNSVRSGRGFKENSLFKVYEDELDALKSKIAGLENILKSVSDLRLTEKRRLILREADRVSGRVTFTSAVDIISRNLAVPYSTVKWNMMKLRSSGLIEAGSKERQSIPMFVTEAGKTAIRMAYE